MNIDELKAKRSEVEQAFSDLKNKHLSLEVELHKLQGAWRFVTDLIKDLEPQQSDGPTAVGVSDSEQSTPVHVPIETISTESVDQETTA